MEILNFDFLLFNKTNYKKLARAQLQCLAQLKSCTKFVRKLSIQFLKCNYKGQVFCKFRGTPVFASSIKEVPLVFINSFTVGKIYTSILSFFRAETGLKLKVWKFYNIFWKKNNVFLLLFIFIFWNQCCSLNFTKCSVKWKQQHLIFKKPLFLSKILKEYKIPQFLKTKTIF